MAVIPFLILFPLVISVVMFSVRVNRIRNAIAYASCAVIMAATVALVVLWAQRGGGVQ